MADSYILERFLIPGRGRTEATDSNPQRLRIFILPTRHGILFAVMLLVMLIGAINYNNSLAYILTFLLGSMLMAGILYTYRNLAGIIITYQNPKAVFAGETARFPFLINNNSCPHRYSVAVNEQPRLFSGLGKKNQPELLFNDFLENQQSQLNFHSPTSMRGKKTLSRLRISTTFPLGLFRAWSYLNHDKACLVYPKPEGVLPFPAPENGEESFLTGKDDGMDDFYGFRKYRAGDSSHAISWKHYARNNTLLVKRFNGLGSQRFCLRWSDTASLPNIEDRLNQLSQWIVSLEEQGSEYALQTPGFSSAFGHGNEHRHNCLKQLALFPREI